MREQRKKYNVWDDKRKLKISKCQIEPYYFRGFYIDVCVI